MVSPLPLFCWSNINGEYPNRSHIALPRTSSKCLEFITKLILRIFEITNNSLLASNLHSRYHRYTQYIQRLTQKALDNHFDELWDREDRHLVRICFELLSLIHFFIMIVLLFIISYLSLSPYSRHGSRVDQYVEKNKNRTARLKTRLNLRITPDNDLIPGNSAIICSL